MNPAMSFLPTIAALLGMVVCILIAGLDVAVGVACAVLVGIVTGGWAQRMQSKMQPQMQSKMQPQMQHEGE